MSPMPPLSICSLILFLRVDGRMPSPSNERESADDTDAEDDADEREAANDSL